MPTSIDGLFVSNRTPIDRETSIRSRLPERLGAALKSGGEYHQGHRHGR